MKNKVLRNSLLTVSFLFAMVFAGCGQGTDETSKAPDTAAEDMESTEDAQNPESNTGENKDTADAENTENTDKDAQADNFDENAPEIPGLTYESTMELTYAQAFNVYYYNDDYALIDIKDGDRCLVVPEGKEVPEGLDEEIIVLQQPLDHIYLAATSAMALFDAVDALDVIRLSGTQTSGWYIDSAVEAMEAGDIIFAGKYSEPDYELLVDEECDLAIESTMIFHTPKVKEMIEDLDIPVLVDRSSYEDHPLGRTEWVKLYSVLTDKEEEAAAFFEDQASIISELKDFQNTEKSVVFFYVSSEGSVVVRNAEDYIPKMIQIAGGRYAFADLETESASSSVPLTMEEFYATAVSADYLVYNASIDSPISSIDELMAKSELFADFKAVKEGNVWCTGKSLYQATDIVGQLITDLNLMLTDGNEEEMTFLTHIE